MCCTPSLHHLASHTCFNSRIGSIWSSLPPPLTHHQPPFPPIKRTSRPHSHHLTPVYSTAAAADTPRTTRPSPIPIPPGPQEERMAKTMAALASNFATIRTGRANPAMLDKIMVGGGRQGGGDARVWCGVSGCGICPHARENNMGAVAMWWHGVKWRGVVWWCGGVVWWWCAGGAAGRGCPPAPGGGCGRA